MGGLQHLLWGWKLCRYLAHHNSVPINRHIVSLLIRCMNIGTLLGFYMESWRIVLGKELRNVRKENGWTQSDVSAKAGIKRAVVSEIENGKFLGAISTLDRYLTLARVDLKPQRLGFDLPQLESLDDIFKDDDD